MKSPYIQTLESVAGGHRVTMEEGGTSVFPNNDTEHRWTSSETRQARIHRVSQDGHRTGPEPSVSHFSLFAYSAPLGIVSAPTFHPAKDAEHTPQTQAPARNSRLTLSALCAHVCVSWGWDG